MSCALSTVSNRTDGFDFGRLYNVLLYLEQTCPPDSNIFFDKTHMLTEATCRKIAGISDSIWSGWTPYPISDIWARIVTWKLPLFQLVAQFPRPPLGFHVETATMAHLLGDPIDSVMSMLLTLAMCQSRVYEAKKTCSDVGICHSVPEYHRTWKALALIMVSYDECGEFHKANNVCNHFRALISVKSISREVRDIYEEAAGSLASDRTTKSLPVMFAEIIFIGGWIIALLKAASTEPSEINWVNVEAQSVAISAMYLWVTSAVVIGCVIGASQTEESIPRIMQHFEYDIADILGESAGRPSAQFREESAWCAKSTQRAINGGIYSWRPSKWRGIPTGIHVREYALVWFGLAATLMVGCSFLTAAILSYLVPPRGPSCRHIVESVMFALWFLSFVLEWVLEKCLRKCIFGAIFWKDTFFTLSTIAVVLVTQWGIMNRCSCWSTGGLTWVHLPQSPEVKPELMYFIRHIAPWITFMAILLQLVFCAAVAWKYWDAVRVFIQRDDGKSNFGWEARNMKRRRLSSL